MNTLSIAIMTTPGYAFRRACVAAMVSQLRNEGVTPTVITDHDRAGPWDTARQAWHTATGTHHLVLQDDIQLCGDFVATCHKLITLLPNEPISLYNSMHKKTREAKASGKSWLQFIDGAVWGQAILLPITFIPVILYWCSTHIDEAYTGDDSRLSMFFRLHHYVTYSPIPSLVQHIGHNQSILGHAGKTASGLRRVSAYYKHDVSTVDWQAGLSNPIRARSSPSRGILRYFKA